MYEEYQLYKKYINIQSIYNTEQIDDEYSTYYVEIKHIASTMTAQQ